MTRYQRRPRKKKNNKKFVLLIALVAVVIIAIVGYHLLSNNVPHENPLNGTNPISDENSTIDESTAMKVLLETSMGDITIQLRDDMPITTGNFKNLVQQGVYDNTIFHRVVEDFMIQGGDPNGNGISDDGIEPIIDEFSDNSENNKNEIGTVAMANAGANTGSSQFFINVKYNSHLDNQHPVFGEVIDGMDVVDAISKVNTDGDPPVGANRPLEDVVLIKASLIE